MMLKKSSMRVISGVALLLMIIMASYIIGKQLFNHTSTTKFTSDNTNQNSSDLKKALIMYESIDQDTFPVLFEYPALWEWNYTDFPLPYWDVCMSTIDPTKPLFGFNEEPNFEAGDIQICVLQINTSNFSPSNYQDELVERWEDGPAVELKIDEMVEIGGYIGRRLVGVIAARYAPMNQVPLIDEIILIVSGERYYEIMLEIPESERMGSYGQAFDHLIETLEFLP